MKTTNMTERITFYSEGIGVVNGVPVNNKLTEEFSCWAEVPKVPLREFVNQSDQVGYRKSSPVFLIAFKQKKEIQTDWIIKWRGQDYEIISMDPDYRTKDIIQIAGKVVQ
ncbi:hypothetical protein LFYK43_14340 [Ligilactobacillus salitolerans]|uniref:Head-tail adaptor protein n=1 Tax=Ligilactobacillus salitolerans TaxID=1808352 RepID=A0A401ITY3_9LACO|nr:phage head closure protein [Ligilactobacillus salitolerans]GBG94975.1 hypothetical protein LFYK43_14340 [Ligilactobacillus salitolerans]